MFTSAFRLGLRLAGTRSVSYLGVIRHSPSQRRTGARHLRPLRRERGRAGAGPPRTAPPWHAVPGRPRLRRLRALARGDGPGRRPALAGAEEPGPALSRAAAGRLVLEPPPRLPEA